VTVGIFFLEGARLKDCFFDAVDEDGDDGCDFEPDLFVIVVSFC
jgi:hypothetical protein